ncbi:Kinetochore protein mis13 [Pleurostoma richardsiae]|uniref:Kinetochore protein mis13 n=1 Tax=Pleurostoma richardsiae TaxID=41990 RepID=A0AA38VPQ5_9PEZI|nr:Kinetochore protein mis13 [Pleurostoma richardsiae]
MTTLVKTRQPLQVLSMTNQPERRKSKRLAAASVYDEQDGDFVFSRGSKRQKTTQPEPEPEQPASAPAKKAAGRSKASASKKRALSPEPEQPQAAPAATSKRSHRRKPSTTPAPAQDEGLVVAKTRTTRRRTRSSMEKGEQDGNPPATNGAADDDSMDVVGGTPAGTGDSRREESPSAQKIALPFSDTPIMNRNKEFRKKAGGSRRSSLGMRGRRASSLIENGHNAIPHREVDPAEFYKHIAADGLSEPRRMKQLLTWCGERALSEKPPLGSLNSNAILGARAIQDQLLKDFASKSEFSDWFAREDEPSAPAAKAAVVMKPNPRNIEHEEKISELETRIKRLIEEMKTWEALEAPPPAMPSLYPDGDWKQAPLPDETLLDAEEAKILQSLTGESSSFAHLKSQTRSRLHTLQSSLEFRVDHFADSVHKLDQRVATGSREADEILALSSTRLKEREEKEKAAVGTKDVPIMEVLRSLGRILPEGSG